MVLAVLLNKTKPHYIEGRTIQIRTIRGPPVVNRKLVFLKILLETFEYSLSNPPLPWNLFFLYFRDKGGKKGKLLRQPILFCF